MRRKAFVAAGSSALLLASFTGVLAPRVANAATDCPNAILDVLPPTLSLGDGTSSGVLEACTFTSVAGEYDVAVSYRLTGPDPGVTVVTYGILPLAAGFNVQLPPTVILTVCVGSNPTNWICVPV